MALALNPFAACGSPAVESVAAINSITGILNIVGGDGDLYSFTVNATLVAARVDVVRDPVATPLDPNTFSLARGYYGPCPPGVGIQTADGSNVIATGTATVVDTDDGDSETSTFDVYLFLDISGGTLTLSMSGGTADGSFSTPVNRRTLEEAIGTQGPILRSGIGLTPGVESTESYTYVVA